MRNKLPEIVFNKPFIAGKELYYIAEAVTKAHLSGNGSFTKRCHEWLQTHLGCVRAFLTHSCTTALEMAAILSDIKVGEEVILPSFTFVSTANAFVLRGAVPVFVDIRPETLNINEDLLEEAITEKTRVIVPVHYAGSACAMDKIMQIATDRQILVVEDAAQAMCSTFKGRCLGTIGHFGCLSFHETKNIISGEGGALLVNREEFVGRSETIWEKGTNRNRFFRGEIDKYTWVDIGSSFLPSELTGAFLYAQLEQAQEINSARRRLCQRYHERLVVLQEKGFLQIPRLAEDEVHNGHLFYVVTESRRERTRLIEYLKNKGINTVFHYVPLHSSPAGIKYGRCSGSLDVTTSLSERLLRLPLYYQMSIENVDRVSDALRQFYLED